jgi:hypothetical protein
LTNSNLGAPRANHQLSLDTLSVHQLSTALKFIYSNENLAVRMAPVTDDYDMLVRDGIVLVDATAASLSINLPPANSWGYQKSPIIIIKRIDNNLTTVDVFAVGGDNIDGGGSITIPALGSAIIVTDSFTDWYTL